MFAVVASAMVVVSTLPATVLGQASFGAELEAAYTYAKEMGITTSTSINSARMYDNLTRAELAKMVSVYATEVMGLTPDMDADCDFTDLAPVAGTDLEDYAVTACQLGLMGVGTNGIFNPNGLVTRAEFGTVLSRVLYGDANNGGTPWYANHLNALKEAGIMNDISNPNMREVRWYTMLMMMRSDEEYTPPSASVCDDPEVVFACLLDIDCPAECQDDVTDPTDPTDPVFEWEGELTVRLSSDTPNWGLIPGNVAWVTVAKYDVSADDEDVRVDSMRFDLLGFSNNDTIEDIALYVDGIGRVSDVEDLNSDDEASLSIDGGLLVRAGGTETISLIVSVADSSTVAGDRFYFDVIEVSSTAEDMNLDVDPSEEFEVGNQDAPTLMVDDGSTVSDVKVWEVGAEIADFELEHLGDTSDEQDITLYSITLENIGSVDMDDYLEDFVLYIDGEEFATAERSFDDYVTFMNEDGFVFEDGDNFKATVEATVNGEVNEDIQLVVSEELDIFAVGEKYGFGAAVDRANFAWQIVEIEAWEVVISGVDPEFDELRDDRDDVVLGKFIINVAEWENLELDQIVFENTVTTNTSGLDSYFENVELFNETRWGKIDLDVTATGFESDNDEDIVLRLGQNVFRLQADVMDVASNPWATETFEFEVNTSNGLTIRETEDDQEVTDVSPSVVSYAAFDGIDTSVDVEAINLSSLTTVVWARLAEAMKFDIEAQGGSELELEEITIGLTTSATSADDVISEVRLYQGSVDPENLLDSQNGNDFNSDEVTFDIDNDAVFIADDSKERFVVTVSFEDDNSLDWETAQVYIAEDGVRLRDDNNDIFLAPTGDDLDSPREFTLTDGWELFISIDTADSMADSSRYIVWWTSSEYIAALDLVNQDEAVEVREFVVQASWSDVNSFDEVVTAVVLYDSEGNVVATENTVAGQPYVTFDNFDVVVPEWTTTRYLGVEASELGYQENSDFWAENLQLYVTWVDARWDSSNQDFWFITWTNNSNTFWVVPVKPASIEFVSNGGGESVPSNIWEWENVVAIVKVTSDSRTNKWSSSSTDAKMVLSGISFEVLTWWVELQSMTIENAQEGTPTAWTANGVFTNLSGPDYYVEPGASEYFVIRATLSGVSAGNDSFQLRLNNLNDGAIEFTTDEPWAPSYNGARLDMNTMTSTKLFGNSN